MGRRTAFVVGLLGLLNVSSSAADQSEDLIQAVREGDTAAVAGLLSAGARSDASDRGHPVLALAALSGRAEVIEALLPPARRWTDGRRTAGRR